MNESKVYTEQGRLETLIADLQSELNKAYEKRQLSREEDVETKHLDTFIEDLESDIADTQLRIKAIDELH